MQKNLPQPQQHQLTAVASKEKFLKVFSPENCLLHAHKIESLPVAMQKNTPSLSSVGRHLGKTFQRSYLMMWLVSLNEILALKHPMSEVQIELCAGEIIATYAHLSIAELSLLFRRIITGEYGDFYERLSTAKVCEFFKKFEQERTTIVVEQNRQKHQSFRYKEGKNNNSPIAHKIKRLLYNDKHHKSL